MVKRKCAAELFSLDGVSHATSSMDTFTAELFDRMLGQKLSGDRNVKK